jgi:hypothetical protein
MLSVRSTTLATGKLTCDIAPTLEAANQIRLRLTFDPRCDVKHARTDVLFDKVVLTHDVIERRFFSGVADSFDSSPFARPRTGDRLTVELKGDCTDDTKSAASDQCEVP